MSQNAVLGYLGLAWIYLTITKASPLRTVGFWLTGARDVLGYNLMHPASCSPNPRNPAP